MRIIMTVLKITLFVLLLGFAARNMDDVAVRYFLGYEWRAPLAFVLLVFFAAGAVLGVAANIAIVVRQRREIVGLKRELRSQARAAQPAIVEQA